MLFLHTLLFFLFGAAMVEARNRPKSPIRQRPLANPAAPRQPVPPHIPPDSYGYWVRCDIDDPQDVSKSLLSNRICMHLTCHIASTR